LQFALPGKTICFIVPIAVRNTDVHQPALSGLFSHHPWKGGEDVGYFLLSLAFFFSLQFV